MVYTCRLVIAANGVAYLPHAARPGIVPRLLQEILSTRIMVKGAMKSTPASHKVLQVNPALHVPTDGEAVRNVLCQLTSVRF